MNFMHTLSSSAFTVAAPLMTKSLGLQPPALVAVTDAVTAEMYVGPALGLSNVPERFLAGPPG